MEIPPSADQAQRVHQAPVAGVDRYRHVSDRALVGEVVRRGIVGSVDDVRLNALALEWRSQVLRTVLAFHDRYPRALWLPGGIHAQHFEEERSLTMASYRFAERSILINLTYYSNEKFERAHTRGNVDGILNHLAGTVFHECWHCAQDAYTPSMKAYVADLMAKATGDDRMRFPLAHRDLRREIIATVGDYAVVNPREFEAELMRVHAQGAPTRMSFGLVSAADALFGPTSGPSTLDRVKGIFTERARQSVVDGTVPRTRTEVQVSDYIVGNLYDEPSYYTYGTSSFLVRYIETANGHLYRYWAGNLIDATASLKARALVSYEISTELQPSFAFSVGEPMWFERQWTDVALPDAFVAAPVKRVVDVLRGAFSLSPDEVAERTRGRRTDLVRLTEQFIAAADPRSVGVSFDESGISAELVRRWWFIGSRREFLRCIEAPDGILRAGELERRAFRANIVVFATNGEQIAIEQEGSGKCSLIAVTNHGRERRFAFSSTSIPELRVGEIVRCMNDDGEMFSFGPIGRIVVVERSPVDYASLRPVRPGTERRPGPPLSRG